MNSKQVNATVNRLISFMGDVEDGNLKTILANMQAMCEYQAEKLRIYEEHLAELTGRGRPELSDSDKRREYLNHYRPHAGLGGKMIHPYPQDMEEAIVEVPFLGGLLHGYRRAKVAA